MNMKNRVKKVTKNDYIFSLLQKGINIITGIFTISLINRYLGSSLKGEYEYILNIVNILNIVLGFGLYASYPYMKRQKMENQLEKYLDVFFLQALVYLIIGLIISVITKNLIVIISIALIITKILSSQMQSIGVVEFIRFRQILQIVSYSIDLILTLFVYIVIPQNMVALLLVLLIKYMVYIIVYLFRCKYLPHPFRIDFTHIKFLFKFGFFSMLIALLSEFNYSIDIIIMELYLPFSEIGLYSVGSKLAQYIWLIPDAFKEVLFSRTARDDSIEEIKMVLRINILVTLIMIFIILVFGKLIIYILYGSEYLKSYAVTTIIFFGIPSMVVYKLLNPLYTANGKQKKCFSILFVSVLINIVLNFLTIPAYGKIGAAISTVMSYTFCGMIFLLDFIKTYNVKLADCLIIKKSDLSKLKNRLKSFL